MKKVLTVMIFSLFVLIGFAQNKQMEEIKAVTESLRLAMVSGNREEMTKLTTTDLSNGHSSGHIDT